MIYGSVCSGIEAATVAWHPLGWEAAFYAEIAKFPSSVLAHHYPKTPNVGDFTELNRGAPPPAIDLLVGGTPCQSFSVAGLRGGLADDRGNLALQFLALAGRARPRWILWENVPGVLSSNEGRDFGSILGGLAELGYGFAYRVLDAQFFGVAQRRNRVFLVGSLGGWAAAAAVLFERSCLRGNPPPRRASRKDSAAGAGGGAEAGGRVPDVANTIGSVRGGWSDDFERSGAFIPEVAGTFTSEGFDASEDGTGRGPQLVAPTLNANGKAAGSITQQDAEAGALVYQCAGGSVGPMGVLRTGTTVASGVPFVEAYGGGESFEHRHGALSHQSRRSL